MDTVLTLELREVLRLGLIVIVVALFVAGLLLIWVLASVRRIRLPADADFFTALQVTPLSVVLLLDLLDLSLDFLSVPIAWTLLGRLGLAPLRGVTVIEELIPGTQLIPTMTFAWILARLARSRLPR